MGLNKIKSGAGHYSTYGYTKAKQEFIEGSNFIIGLRAETRDDPAFSDYVNQLLTYSVK